MRQSQYCRPNDSPILRPSRRAIGWQERLRRSFGDRETPEAALTKGLGRDRPTDGPPKRRPTRLRRRGKAAQSGWSVFIDILTLLRNCGVRTSVDAIVE